MRPWLIVEDKVMNCLETLLFLEIFGVCGDVTAVGMFPPPPIWFAYGYYSNCDTILAAVSLMPAELSIAADADKFYYLFFYLATKLFNCCSAAAVVLLGMAF